MADQVLIGMYEYSILRAIKILKGDAYGAKIDRFLAERLGRIRITSQVYVALTRLKERGFVSFTDTEPLPQRGGRKRHIFTIEPKGLRALQEIEAYFEKLRDD